MLRAPPDGPRIPSGRPYTAFVRHRLLTPTTILDAGLEFLIDPIMREGGYVRYDGRKSTQILRDCRTLIDDYGGSLRRLHQVPKDREDLEWRLLDLYGVGPITVNDTPGSGRTRKPSPTVTELECRAADGAPLASGEPRQASDRH